jgi:hypothetical protein
MGTVIGFRSEYNEPDIWFILPYMATGTGIVKDYRYPLLRVRTVPWPYPWCAGEWVWMRPGGALSRWAHPADAE